MNFVSKFDPDLPADGLGSHPNAHVHVETVSARAAHAPSDAIIVPDAQLLFNGDFKRSGLDLVLSKDDHELVLHDYFKGEKRAALSSPDGAHLTGDLINALTGHVQYAQADGNASVGKVIGHITKLAGTATAIRNGVSIILNQGDNVEKGDVVQSGSNSTLGITFIDGTVFGLSSNARMVLNEMVYDPNGSNNSSLLSLVAGTISFVAGETAKHGDMKIDTPVATMGIRGTAVLVEIDFQIPLTDPNAPPLPGPPSPPPTATFQVLVEPDGTTGSYILFEKNTLTPIATVNQAGQQVHISQGVVSITSTALSADLQKLITDVFSLKFTSTDTNPKTFEHFTDTLIPQSLTPFMLANGATAIPVIANVNSASNTSFSSSNGPTNPQQHIDLPPTVVAFGNTLIVRSPIAHGPVDSVSGTILFADINAGDRPTVTTKFDSFKLFDAQHNDITATLTAQQLAAIAAVELDLAVAPRPGNDNNGSATWTYSVAEKAFDFLGGGQTLELTYQAEVDNNYPPLDAVVSKPFTITIRAPNIVDWIHPTGGLWSDASNWETGVVPTSSDDVAIPDELVVGGTYAVTIASPAAARSVTVNAYDKTGAQLINDSTLTIGEALTVLNDGVLNNFGVVSVGGQMELLNQSLLQNSGLIALGAGGDFKDQSIVSNSSAGTIEVTGGTLNVLVDVANSGLVAIDSGATLTLNQATITGGTVTNNGIIDLTGTAALMNGLLGNPGQVNVSGSGNALDGETVINGGTINVTGVLTLDLGTSVTGGTLTNSGIVKIEAASGATLDGVNVQNGSGVIQIDDILSPDASTLVADDGTTISGGTLTIGSVGTFEVTSAVGATLDGVSVGNSGLVQIDAGSRLNLDGTTITGGTVTDGGTIEVTGNSSINSASVNGGQVTVDAATTLTLDGTTVTGTTITDGGTVKVDIGQTLDLSGVTLTGGAISNLGFIDITGDSSISGDALSNNQLTVDATRTLTLNGTIITGGIVTDSGIIHVIGDSAINDAAIIGGQIVVDAGLTLTLNGTTVTGTVITDDGAIQIDVGKTRFLSGVALSGGTINNFGTLDVIGDSSISNDVLNNNQLTIDSTKTLTLDGTTVTGGTVTDNGTIHITGDSAINSAALNGGQVTVDLGKTLTLDGTTVTGTTITDSGTVKVDATRTLNLSGVALSGGAISNLGTIDIIGDSSISSDALSNNQLTIDSTKALTLNGTTITGGTVTDGGAIHVTGDSAINSAALNGGQVTVDLGKVLTLDGTTVTGTTITDSGTVKVDVNKTLNLSGVALSGGAISNLGTIDIIGDSSISSDTLSNNQLTIDSTKTLTLDGTTITGGTVTDNGTIYAITTVDISGNIIGTGAIDISNLAQLEIGGSVASTNTVFFQGVQGELILDHSNQFSGLITGSSVGTILTLDDEIDLRDLPFTSLMSDTVSYDSSLNISTVTFSDGTPANNMAIRLSGNYTDEGWKFTNDGSGGTLVQLAPRPVFSDIIDGQFAFTGDKTGPGTIWTFQAAVTDADANLIGQGGITKFELSQNGTLLGSATFDGSTWTFSGLLASVSYAGGIYTITTSSTPPINNNDILKITAYDAANLSASKSATLHNESSFNVAPAGIAGDPIHLALTDPSGGQSTGPIQLTFTGVPSDWSINEGTNLGNGIWTVGTNDLSALTITTAAAYTGAMVLSVTETWKNADGSTEIAVISDNIEAYAPGSPIFALSGNDTLTGAGGNDLFVFAQPIGHDTVYSFDAAHDQIDLIGYAGFTSFADIQAHLTEDASGNALITMGDGQSIELQGVHAAALTQSNFVFDQTPTLDNAGTMTIGDGAVMPLSGTINNTGTIALSSTGDETDLQLIEHGVTLEGGGKIVLSDSDANVISGTSSDVTLNNEDNTISGAGHLGNGELTLTNAGTIDATGIHALTIDTGSNWVFNSGVLEASGSGGMTVASSIVNSGVLWANGASLTVQGAVSGNGTATIDGSGTLDFEASSTANVVFGSGATGTLKLGDSFHFNGTITGFGASDIIDLADVGSTAASISYHENAAGTGGTLAISGGAQTVELSLVGHYSADNFSIVPDHVNGTLIAYVPHDLIV